MVAPTSAHANRKRVVVLELDGPKAERFHDDLIKIVKKTHTVVPLDKWNSTADDLGATRNNDKDVKKVAKKLKVDAIVFGKVDKRRDEYIISLQIRAGRSGQVVGNRVDTKSEGPRIDGKAGRDIKDELVDAISSLERARSADDEDEEEDEDTPVKKGKKDKDADEEDDDEDKPVKKSKKSKDADEEDDEDKPVKKGKKSKKDKDADEEDDEDKPVKKGFSRKQDSEEEEDEDRPVKKGFSRKQDDDDTSAALRTKKDDDEEEDPLPKKKKGADDDEDEDGEKQVASSEDEDEDEDDKGDEDSVEAEADGEELDPEQTVSPAERALDLTLGLSFNMRKMAFDYESDLASKPPPYSGVPVAGVFIDAEAFPLAFGHKERSMKKNIGVTVMYDRVIKIESKAQGMVLPTSQQRWAVGATFRYPIGTKAVVGARLRYGRQNFTIGTSNGVGADIPNVNYSIIEPAATLKVQAAPKVVINAKLAFLGMMDTGAIQKTDQYGAATVKGFELELGGDYMLTRNIFARAAFKYETIGFEFDGSGMLSTARDMDPEQDVFGASDSYYGGTATIGVLY